MLVLLFMADAVCGSWAAEEAPRQYPLISDGGPRFSDVNQGMIGDCYLLAALAAIAHTRPGMIRKLFLNSGEPAVSGRTVYRLLFNWDGRNVDVAVDDMAPRVTERWFGATPTATRALWPVIVEKAFAKLFGAYSSIDGGFTFEAFKAISQAPVHTIEFWYCNFIPVLDSVESFVCGWTANDIWSFLRKALTSSWPMVAESPDHAFALLESGTRTVGGKRVRALRLFDPRGFNAYAGAIEGQPTQRGDFWLTFDEFLRNFKDIRYAEIQERSRVVSRRVAPGSAVFRLTTSSTEQFSVNLAWPSSRLFNNTCQWEVSSKMVVALTGKPLGLNAASAKRATKNRDYVSYREAKVSAGPGEYLIFVSTDFGYLSSAIKEVSVIVQASDDDRVTLKQESTKSFKSLCIKALGLRCIPLLYAARQRKHEEKTAERARESELHCRWLSQQAKKALDRIERLNKVEELLRGEEDSEFPPWWASVDADDRFGQWKSNVTWASLSGSHAKLASESPCFL